MKLEETFMKHSKSHGGAGGGSAGFSGLLSNYDAYQRWVRAAHERVQFVKGALAMVDMLADDSDAKKLRDLRRTEIERTEANVVKVAEAIVGFINTIRNGTNRQVVLCFIWCVCYLRD